MPRIATTTVVEWNEGRVRSVVDDLAGEDPLEIRVDDTPVGITMRTPGHDSELAVGYLLTEGLISSGSDLLEVEPAVGSSPAPGVVRVRTNTRLALDPSRHRRYAANSSCGVCGRASLEALRDVGLERPARSLAVDGQKLCAWADRIRSAQDVFRRTGGLHAAALFGPDDDLLVLREDIGRHNAVDKVVGWALLNGRLPLSGCGLLVSGRGGFEIVQKSLAAGLELVACVSAPSSLAVQLAREFGLTLVGFLRARRFIVYSGDERIRAA